MTKGRLEAFSDGVIAILITIMVIELHIARGAPGEAAHDYRALLGIGHQFFAYVLSFVYLGIYWNNHHHMLHAADRVSAGILWANLHLLFWLSLVPATTAWMGETSFAPWPIATYSAVLLCAAFADTLLQAAIIRAHGPESRLRTAVGNDRKGKISLLAYTIAIPMAFVSPVVAGVLLVGVALLWLIPDRRIERVLEG